MQHLNEDAIEYAANNLFTTELGYTEIIWGPDIAPEGARMQERDFNEVVLRGRLETAINKLKPHLPADAREDVIRKVLRVEFPDTLSNNFAFHRLLTEGVDVSFRNAQGEIRTDKAQLVDFAQPERNEFVAVRQLTVIENQKNRRADSVIYVNGLPLVLLEFKNPLAQRLQALCPLFMPVLPAEPNQTGATTRVAPTRSAQISQRLTQTTNHPNTKPFCLFR
jgi:type I restriction enzyme, R subunit